MTTMRDVAEQADVSVATVSAFVTGKRYVSPELKSRIEQAIEHLGYQMDGLARSLRKGSSDLIGLVIPDIGNPFFTEFVRDVEAQARAGGFATVLADSNYDVATELRMLNLMRTQRVDGIILCPAGKRGDYAFRRWPDSLKSGATPMVVVDNPWEKTPFDHVTLDNIGAGLMLTRHIIDQGHRDIAVIAGPQGNHASDERLLGYAKAMNASGIATQPDFIRHGDFRESGGHLAARALLDLPHRPSAIFVANNNMLIGTVRALHDAGLDVPRDMSVASVDDFPWAGAFRPGLTIARQPVADFAAHAFHMLRGRWSEPDQPTRQSVTLPAELVIRESVAKR
jgi:LacI family transcriptional regulator